MSSNFQENTLSKALTKVKRALLGVGLISCLVNLLMLTGPLFMLQVYDRVLASGSVPTLVVLLALVVGLYVLAGGFDFIRTLVLARTAFWIESNVGRTSFAHWIATPTDPTKPGYRPLQDLSAVRQFLSTPIAGALFDLPWFPFYLAIVFVLHPMLGWLAVGGAIVVVLLALINEAVTSKSAAEASSADLRESRFADQSKQNMETIRAMGMATGIGNVWSEFRNRSLGLHQTSGERSQVFAATSKYTRMLLQSCILALGAYLAINQEISAGAIVAASIIAGRALAPIDQVIGGWRNVKSTRLSYNRLREFLDGYKGEGQEKVSLPDPKGPLSVQAVTKIGMTTPGEPNKPPILTNVSFQLEPGDGLGVIGPSAAGKSSLAKLLVGIWLPERGAVRLDGATFDQWDPTLLGPHIGYVPQDAALMSGTIAQNISRFENEPEDQEVVEAAKTAGVHEMILRLPDGYSTPLDTAVSPLSGGQRQRIALARALYRKPHLIVLDEPNSNLDAEGDAALAEAIKKMRENGSIVVVMAHRPSAIAAVNKVLMLANGQVMDFGDKADVLQRVTRAA